MVLAGAQVSIFTLSVLMPCFVISCSVVKNVVCPSVVVSLMRIHSLGVML